VYQRIAVMGRLGRDPEVRFTGNGRACARFSVACDEKWKDAQGQEQKHTEWFNVAAWGPMGEACGRFLGKGLRVLVEGTMRTREYEQNGERKRFTELVASNVRFIDFREDAQRGAAAGGNGQQAGSQGGNGDAPWGDDDIPF